MQRHIIMSAQATDAVSDLKFKSFLMWDPTRLNSVWPSYLVNYKRMNVIHIIESLIK